MCETLYCSVLDSLKFVDCRKKDHLINAFIVTNWKQNQKMLYCLGKERIFFFIGKTTTDKDLLVEAK